MANHTHEKIIIGMDEAAREKEISNLAYYIIGHM